MKYWVRVLLKKEKGHVHVFSHMYVRNGNSHRLIEHIMDTLGKKFSQSHGYHERALTTGDRIEVEVAEGEAIGRISVCELVSPISYTWVSFGEPRNRVLEAEAKELAQSEND